jgi:hypothetical protein
MSPHDVVLAPAFNDDTHWLPVTLQHLAQNVTDIVLARMTAADSRVSLRARQYVARFLPKYQD